MEHLVGMYMYMYMDMYRSAGIAMGGGLCHKCQMSPLENLTRVPPSSLTSFSTVRGYRERIALPMQHTRDEVKHVHYNHNRGGY